MVKHGRYTVFALTFYAPVALADGGFANIFRSVTSALEGQHKKEDQPKATATLGVRGMDDVEADAKSGAKYSEDYQLMEGWSSTPADTENMAKERGLSARPVTLASSSKAATARER